MARPTAILALVVMLCLWGDRALAGEPPKQERALASCAGFASVQEIEAVFATLVEGRPDIARAVQLGTSVEGRPIVALLVGRDPPSPGNAVAVRILGGLHGDECLSVQTALDLAEWLVENEPSDPMAKQWVSEAFTAIVPVVNPDGYEAKNATRANATGVDLNRDLSFAALNSYGASFSQPETRAIRALNQFASFRLGVELHTVERYVNAPWNHTPHHPPDEFLFARLMNAYAGDSGYRTTFGWDWYAVNGDMNDWSYGTAGTLDFTVELRSDLKSELEVHAAGIFALIEEAATAVTGTVRDADSGEPLVARIELVPEAAPVFTSPEDGVFRRLVVPGTFAVTAHAPAHRSATVKVTVEPNIAASIDFELIAETGASLSAFAIVGTSFPHSVPGSLGSSTYLDESLAFDALGPADGIGYSLKPGGSLTVDLGKVVSADGARLEIISSTGSGDRVSVAVAQAQDGPFEELGQGAGDFDVELSLVLPVTPRFVRLVDLNDGPFNDEEPGYDVDAVSVVFETESDTDSDPAGDEDIRAMSGVACGCGMVGKPRNFGPLDAWLALLR